jgi:hypothetical protein
MMMRQTKRSPMIRLALEREEKGLLYTYRHRKKNEYSGNTELVVK